MYRWVEHTSELELAIEAPTEAGVVEDAVAAFGELLGGEDPGEPAAADVDVTGGDRATLLAGLLEELVYLNETRGLVPRRPTGLDLGEGRLRTRVEGERGGPTHLVKAVTYHRLAFEPSDGGWRATVVLDV